MPLSFVQLEDAVERIVGSAPDPRLSVEQIVNDAGQYLFNMAGWQWRKRPPATITLTPGQAWVALPADFGFGQLLEVSTGAVIGNVEIVSVDRIVYLRDNGYGAPLAYYAAVAWPNQSSTQTGLGAARLEMYPTPSSADTLTVTYMAGWVTLSKNFPSACANVPPAMEQLLAMLVRAFARYSLTDDMTPIEAIERSAMLERLKQADGGVQAFLGPIEGGMFESAMPPIDPNWNFTVSGVS